VSRRIVEVDDGVLRIEQRLRIRGRDIGTDVSGPACVYAQVSVTRGTVAYLQGDTRVSVPRCFEVFLPPFAIVQATLERCDVTTVAIAFRAPGGLPQEPVLLPASSEGPVRSQDDVLQRLRVADKARYAGRAPNPAPLVARAKAIIDAEYGTALEIGRVAERLHMSPAGLSRAFREAYGVPPVRYRHQVRVMDALIRFAEGALPVNVFQDVGFDDLSRFYKIFRKVACAAPGSYRPRRTRNAKT
jgi:AraC-like DNA-binding protein